MITLSSPRINVHILHPLDDRQRLGSRYCTGGYIWQVTTAQGQDLLSGPEYPAEPNTFDGQGAPDMFFTPLGAEGAPVGAEVGVIGVGIVRRTSAIEPFYVMHNREVIEWLDWEVDTLPTAVTMRAAHSFRNWGYRLERAIQLNDGTLQSRTTITSTGSDMLPIRWFAHPFFPITADEVYCRFSMPISMPDNPGFYRNGQDFLCRKSDHDWKKGWYQPLEYEPQTVGISVEERHPLLPQVLVETDFAPTFLPVWSNANTLSFEPYYIREMQNGETASWEITYTF